MKDVGPMPRLYTAYKITNSTNGRAYERSYVEMTASCGIHESSLKRYLRELRALGAISSKRGGRGGLTTHTIHQDKMQAIIDLEARHKRLEVA